MRSSYGGKSSFEKSFQRFDADYNHRITKLMGESFKLHSQALVGYEDAVASGTSASTPTMSSQGVDLDMDTTFQAIQA